MGSKKSVVSICYLILIVLLLSLAGCGNSEKLNACQTKLDGCNEETKQLTGRIGTLQGQNAILQTQVNDAILERESWKNATGVCQENLGRCQKLLTANADLAKGLSGGGIIFQILFAVAMIHFGKLFDDDRFKNVKIIIWVFWGLVWLLLAYISYEGWFHL